MEYLLFHASGDYLHANEREEHLDHIPVEGRQERKVPGKGGHAQHQAAQRNAMM